MERNNETDDKNEEFERLTPYDQPIDDPSQMQQLIIDMIERGESVGEIVKSLEEKYATKPEGFYLWFVKRTVSRWERFS